jgi:uncharacterized membrane protein
MDVNAPVTLIGAGYGDPEGAVHDFATVWASRHDGDFHHVSAAVLSRDSTGSLHVQRYHNTAKHLEWGGALLGAGLVVLAPAAGVEILTRVGWSGAGAMVGHFRQHTEPEDLATIADVLAAGTCALVAVVVNRSGQALAPLLRHADGQAYVDMPWGDLEEELSADFAHPAWAPPAVAV